MKKNYLSIFLLCIIAALPFNIERKILGAWITTSDVLIVFALIAWVFKTCRKKTSSPRLLFPLLPLISGLLLTFALSAIWAIDPMAVFRETLKFILLFGFFYLLVNEISDEKSLSWIPAIIFVSSSIISIWFVSDFFYNDMWRHYGMKTWGRHPFSKLHYNLLGSYLGLSIPFAFYLLTIAKKYYMKAIVIVMMIAQYTALVFTYSRINWLVVTVATLIYMVFRYKFKGIAYATLILIVPFTLIMYKNPELKIRERLLSTFDYKDGSLMERRQLTGAAVDLILKKPLTGVGLGNFSAASDRYLGKKHLNDMVHNIYLQFWAEAGIAAMVLLIALIFKYYFDARLIISFLNFDHFLRPLVFTSIISFTILILSNQFGDPFVRHIKEYFALLLALPYAVREVKKIET